MMVSFFRWLMGSVRFRIQGSPERFYNQCAKKGIFLWGMQAGTEPSAWVEAGQYRHLRLCARRAGCTLRCRERRGLPFRTVWMKRRKGVPVGILLAVILLGFLSSRVWNIEVEGDGTVRGEEIRAACAEAGLWEGMPKSQLQPHQIQQRLMQEFPEISWMTVNTQGSTARIQFTEGVEKPEMQEDTQPSNLKAAVAGQVIRVEVFSGAAAVKAGDAVVPGQLLISGTVENGASPLVHADGKVIASTERSFTASVPLTEEIRTLSGNRILRRSLRILGVPIPLSFSTEPLEGEWDRSITKTWLRVNGNTLPVSWSEEVWEEVTVGERKLGREEAEERLREEIRRQQEELSDLEVLEQTESFAEQDGSLVCVVTAKCRENIAIQSEILIK